MEMEFLFKIDSTPRNIELVSQMNNKSAHFRCHCIQVDTLAAKSEPLARTFHRLPRLMISTIDWLARVRSKPASERADLVGKM